MRSPVAWLPAASFGAAQFYTSLAALSSTPPVGVLLVGRTGAALLAALIALGAAVACGIAVRTRPPPPSTGIVLSWLAVCAIATLCGFDPGIGAGVLGLMACTGVVHVALVARPESARPVLAVYLVTGTLAAAAGIAMQIARVPEALAVANLGRAASVFVTANQFAAFLVTFIPTAVGVALASRDRRTRVAAGAAVAVGLAALALTFSRSGWLGTFAAGIFLAATLGRRRLAALATLGALAAGCLLALRPGAHHNPAEGFTRVGAYAAGVRTAELFPLIGVGPLAYRHAYAQLRGPENEPVGSFAALHPHDVYLSLLAEEGVTGLAVAALGWRRFARLLRTDLRAAPPSNRLVAIGICAGLVGTLVQGLFDTVGVVEETFTWIPFMGLALAVARAPARRP